MIGAQVPLRHAHTAQDECVQGKTRKTNKTSKMIGYYKSGQTTKEGKQFEMSKNVKKKKEKEDRTRSKEPIYIVVKRNQAKKKQTQR